GEGFIELRYLAGRHEVALDPAVLVEAGLLEAEDLVELDGALLHAGDLADAGDAPRTVAEAGLLDDQLHRRGDLLANGLYRQVHAGHQHHHLETAQHVARAVGVAGGQRAVVTGVHRLQHVQGFAAATLADHDAVRAHPQTVAHQVANGHLTLALHVRRARLEADHVRLDQLELGGVCHRHHALLDRDEVGKDVPQGRVARAGNGGLHEVEGLHHRRPRVHIHLPVDRAIADQVVGG